MTIPVLGLSYSTKRQRAQLVSCREKDAPDVGVVCARGCLRFSLTTDLIVVRTQLMNDFLTQIFHFCRFLSKIYICLEYKRHSL